MDRFIASENIKHYRERLWLESDPETRSRLQKLLVAEEDKLGADLELAANIERHIADCNRRIARQRELVADMERNGHDGIGRAQTLLDGLIESQVLHVSYRERVLIAIKQNHL